MFFGFGRARLLIGIEDIRQDERAAAGQNDEDDCHEEQHGNRDARAVVVGAFEVEHPEIAGGAEPHDDMPEGDHFAARQIGRRRDGNAVDDGAVGAVQIADFEVAARRAANFGVLIADALMGDVDVALLVSPDDDARFDDGVFGAVEIGRRDDEPGAHGRGDFGDGIGIFFLNFGLAFVLDIEAIIADADFVAQSKGRRTVDFRRIDFQTVTGFDRFDKQTVFGRKNARMLARNVALFQANGIAFLSAYGYVGIRGNRRYFGFALGIFD